MKPTYLFYGFGSEYVLHSIFTIMVRRGYSCIEIDALTMGDSRKLIDNLKGSPVIFITSAHLNLSEKNFKHFYKTESHFYGVLEILSLLKPIKKIYIPHDLTQPLIDYEKEVLNQFDIFLSPCEPFTSMHAPYCKTIEVGWIKYKKNKRVKSKGIIWFLSDFVIHLRMGAKQSRKFLHPILHQGVGIKFPLWPGHDEFEDYFNNLEYIVYPAEENTIELIQKHDTILTNGLSSLIAESYFMGKNTINIMEGSHYGENIPYVRELCPDVVFIDKIHDFKLTELPRNTRKPTLQPFDMKTAINVITN